MVQTMDSRYPTCTNGDTIAAAIRSAVGEGATLVDVDAAEPFYIAADTPAIRACIDTYNEVTGENATPFTMGGGTYARHFPYAVSFGPEHNDTQLPDFGGPMHGANEAAPVSLLLEALEDLHPGPAAAGADRFLNQTPVNGNKKGRPLCRGLPFAMIQRVQLLRSWLRCRGDIPPGGICQLSHPAVQFPDAVGHDIRQVLLIQASSAGFTALLLMPTTSAGTPTAVQLAGRLRSMTRLRRCGRCRQCTPDPHLGACADQHIIPQRAGVSACRCPCRCRPG